MVSIPSLELVVGEAHVCFAYIVVFPLHTSLVYDRRLEAVSTKKAAIHVSAVARFVICVIVGFAVVIIGFAVVVIGFAVVIMFLELYIILAINNLLNIVYKYIYNI